MTFEDYAGKEQCEQLIKKCPSLLPYLKDAFYHGQRAGVMTIAQSFFRTDIDAKKAQEILDGAEAI